MRRGRCRKSGAGCRTSNRSSGQAWQRVRQAVCLQSESRGGVCFLTVRYDAAQGAGHVFFLF
ncbi:hypothetical protein HMPREF9120_00932 [Neisseria sp. oral taxon 020 str. F0370]|nr:hypothetical protein HMPREF9120_00932 [Neisseria sp. oral taxon 020 str. F0370]